MTVLDDFCRALERVPVDRIHHPHLGTQERVLCYELYHQLRLLEESGESDCNPASLHAELDKRTQRLFQHKQAIPDFVVHEPGTQRRNLAVVEVKRARARWSQIASDVSKLARFADELGYKERILIVFNGAGESLDKRRDRISRLFTGGDTIIHVLFYDVRDRSVDHREITYPACLMNAASGQAGPL